MIQKLKIASPETFLVNQYLLEIAKAYKVDWTIEGSAPKYESQVALPFGYQSNSSYPCKECAGIPMQESTNEKTESLEFQTTFPTIPSPEKTQTHDPDFDELEKRFEALKKKK